MHNPMVRISLLLAMAILTNAQTSLSQMYQWDITTVDVSSGDATSLKIDSKDFPHISHYDNINFNLKYAKWNGSVWVNETVTTIGAYSYFTSLALDNNDFPHISYQFTFSPLSRELRYAKWNGSAWNIETVDPAGNSGWDSSLQLDANNFPHISYNLQVDAATSALKYARWNGSAWNVEIVDTTPGVVINHTSLALDSAGNPHIAYWDYTNGDLKYAHWRSTGWVVEAVDTVGNVGINPSLILDSQDRPHITYGGGFTSGNLKYASWNGLTWTIVVVDNAPDVGQYSSLALDQDGYPHIAYRDRTNDHLKFARWNGTQWELETVDASPENTGQCTSMALSRTDRSPRISYLEATNNTLRYAQGTDSVAPAAVTDLSASPGSSAGTVDLSWTAPGDNGSSGTILTGQYRIEYSLDPNASWGGAGNFSAQWTMSTTPGKRETFTITGLMQGKVYYFWIKTADERPNWSPVSNQAQVMARIAEQETPILTISQGAIKISRGESARITVILSQNGQVRLGVYDLTGRRVARLIEGVLPVGSQEVFWDGAGSGSGTYWVTLEAEGKRRIKKIVVVR